MIEVVEVDPFDRAAFDAWHSAYFAADRHGREEYAATWWLEESRAEFQQPTKAWSLHAFAGVVDGRVVATGSVSLPQLDNLHRAEIEVHTVPDQRRRGHGSAVLARCEAFAAAQGRRVMGAEVPWPYAAGPEGSGQTGPCFARRHGYELVLADVQRELALPVPAERLARLAAEAAPHHAAYTLRSWTGPIPDDLVQGWCELAATLDTEAPLGGVDLEPGKADVEALREEEELLVRQGRARHNTVALDADGAVVAYTDIITTAAEPDRAYQWGTLVRADHRGHRLGVALKVANLRLVQRERPGITRITTYNAEVNAPMIAINQALGYVPVERVGEFQKQL